MLFIAPLYASSSPASGGFDVMAFMPIVMVFAIFYFLILRPQQKKTKQHQELLSTLQKGDCVVTSGGLMGVISKVVDDQEVEVEIAEDVKVRMVRSTITSVLSKNAPVSDHNNEDKSEKNVSKPDEKSKKTTQKSTKKVVRRKTK